MGSQPTLGPVGATLLFRIGKRCRQEETWEGSKTANGQTNLKACKAWADSAGLLSSGTGIFTWVALILATQVIDAFASCPNYCNGLGTCGVGNTCICPEGFFGGDCSLSTFL